MRMQTVRYTKFIHGVFAAEVVVFVRADDMNWFTTDIPDVPPGESPVEPSVGRWSRVTISHTSPIENLVAEEARHYGPDTFIRVITDYTFVSAS